MNLGACGGHANLRASYRRSPASSNYDRFNRSNPNNFFHRENYLRVLQCLDGGHKVSMDLIAAMKEYRSLLKDFARRLKAYSNKWRSKLEHQSTLSSYNTTKRAQLQTFSAPEQHAQLLQARRDAIQQVIDIHRTQVDEMYVRGRFSTTHKHYRTDDLKRSFETAYSPLREAIDTLQKLREDKETARGNLDTAKSEYENPNLDSTTSKNEQRRAKEKIRKRQGELETIKQNIVHAEDVHTEQKIIYWEKATDVFKQCQALEQERLNQITQVLIDFNQAVHSSEYSTELDQIFENLIWNIVNKQNSIDDLDFWARTYGVVTVIDSSLSESEEDNESVSSPATTEKKKKPLENETESVTTTDDDKDESTSEDEQSVVVRPTTRRKMNKKSTGTGNKHNRGT